jgi:hypothetical protein
MQHQRQRKIKSSLSRIDPGDLVSTRSAGLYAVLFVGFFFMYIQVFHAAIQYSPDEEASAVAAVNDDVGAAIAAAETATGKHGKHKLKHNRKNILLLMTTEGDIKIVLRPDLSTESTDYIYAMLSDSDHCSPCNLYRAEKPGILQGVLSNKNIPVPTVKGSCPVGSEDVPNDCPKWDKSCGCHGPVMTRGYVGWAAGETGPDFFISNYEKPATWWGTQHTLCKSIVWCTDTSLLSIMTNPSSLFCACLSRLSIVLPFLQGEKSKILLQSRW